MKRQWSPWRDERGRFVKVTLQDVANAIREERRVVFERPVDKPKKGRRR